MYVHAAICILNSRILQKKLPYFEKDNLTLRKLIIPSIKKSIINVYIFKRKCLMSYVEKRGSF